MAKWLATLIIFFPLSLHQLDYRSRWSGGLSLRMKKTSPAYAVLEDSVEAYIEKTDYPVFREQAILGVGRQRFIPPFRSASKNLPQRLALRPLVIKQGFKTREPLQANMDLRVETAGSGLLPIEERKRILVQYFKKQDFSMPDLQTQVKKLVEEEDKRTPFASEGKVLIGEQTHTPIIVAKPGSELAVAEASSIVPLLKSQLPGARANGGVALASVFHGAPRINTDSQEKVLEATKEPSLTVSSVIAAGNRPYYLKGQLQVKDGLAFIGPETFFTLRRINEGVAYEVGQIWISEARFEIRVKEPRGQLIAELHSRSGGLLGRGVVDLDTEFGSENKPIVEKKTVGELLMELTPVTTGAAVHVISAYSNGPNQIPVAAARVTLDQNVLPVLVADEGGQEDVTRAHHSTYLVEAQAKEHWPTIAVGVEGQNQEIRLYPESLVKSLLDISLKGSDRQKAETSGVVWGRIVKDGKPVSGVQVELAGDYPPVYFNQAQIPDVSQKVTTENGLFAFLMVRPGVQAIRVRYNDKMYPAQVLPSKEHHVSYVEIRLESHRAVNVGLADAFDPAKRLSAHVRFIGVDDEVQVADHQKLNYAASSDTMLLEADAGPDYELSRVQVLRSDTEANVPLLRRDWLQSLIGIKQINLLPLRGTLAGFIADQPFQVSLSGHAVPEQSQLVYFDSVGRIVDGDSGPAGGGFILFNAPLGLQSVQIKPIYKSGMFTQTFVAEPEFIHSFKYAFGASSQ